MLRNSRTFRYSLLTLAVAAGIQTANAQQGQMEEIQITGTRISRTTMDTPTPVTTISADDLANMAPGSLVDGLVQMPQYYNNQTPNQENGGQNSGGANINLRGAGSNRTLVLIDGRRMVPTNRFGNPDVNSIPEDLLKTVETVTGGASASYGTDAVAGVANFILDTNFVGLKTHMQTGITELGDGKNWEAGAAYGIQLNDKFHVMGSLSMADSSAVSSPDSLRRRDYYRNWSRVTNPNTSGPTELIRPYVYPTNYTNTGIIVEPNFPALNRLVFNPDGSVTPLNVNGVGGSVNSGCQCIASATPTRGVNNDEEVMNPYRRYNGFLHAKYQLNEDTELFAQVLYSRNWTSDRWQNIPLLAGWQGRIYADNPYLRSDVAALIAANKPANAQFVGFGIFAPNTANTVLGEAREDTLNHMDTWTTGIKGKFNLGFLKDWTYNTYVQFGENTQDFIEHNGVRTDRLFIAMDAVTGPTGQPICRVNMPQFTGSIASGGNGGLFKDCVPINLIGGVSNVTKAAADYMMDRDGKDARQWSYQRAFEFVINGDLFEGFGAGPIGAAAGISYRNESLTQKTTNPADEYPAQINGTLLSDQGLMPAGIRGIFASGPTTVPGYNGLAGLRFVPTLFSGDQSSSTVLFSSLREISGGFTVKEAFGELNVPLLKDATLAKNVEVDLAGRYADYSGSGGIWAWKAGLNWTINDEIRVRATQSRDVRAASLRERFDQTRGGITVTNPWQNNVVVSASSFSGGNPNVSPEEADTTTVGLVYRPSWLDGLSMSIDHYYIDINNAIAQLTSQNIVNGCRTGDLTLCQYVISNNVGVTDPLSNTVRPIERVDNLFINLANQRIEGTDFEATYKTDLKLIGGAAESMTLRFLYSRLDENSIQNKGALRDDRAGQIGGFGFAKNKANIALNYNYDTYSAFLQVRWIDGGLLDRTYLESSTPVPLSARPADSILVGCGTNICTVDKNNVPSITYVDLRVAKTFGADNKMEVFANVNNLLDREPIPTPGAIGRAGTGGAFQTALYDVLGRRYTLGMNYSF